MCIAAAPAAPAAAANALKVKVGGRCSYLVVAIIELIGCVAVQTLL